MTDETQREPDAVQRARQAVVDACAYYVSEGYSGLDRQYVQHVTPRLYAAIAELERAVRLETLREATSCFQHEDEGWFEAFMRLQNLAEERVDA